MHIISETERLTIRHFDLKDATFIFELLNTPGWINNIGDRNITSIKDAEEYLKNKLIPSYEKDAFGFYACILKETGEAIGMNGLIHREGLDDIDIGYAFLPQYWRQGYAYETSIAIIEHAKTDLGIKKLLAITEPKNEASNKLLLKIGMNYQRTVEIPNIDGLSNLYELKL